MIVQRACKFVDSYPEMFELEPEDVIHKRYEHEYEVFRKGIKVEGQYGTSCMIVKGPKLKELEELCKPLVMLPAAPTEPADEPTDYFKQKADQGKRQWSLVVGSLYRGLEEVVKVREFGFKKYGSRDGWRSVADCEQRYTDALLRHAASYASGERLDAESGLPTLAHLACDVLFLLTLQAEKAGEQ